MSQHDYNIANGGGAAVRSDINSALGAIQSLNSGATAPTVTVAGMLWYDTLTGSMKQRNAGNTAWVSAAEFISGGQLAGLRNRIINGDMRIAQRGTSFAAIAAATNTYTLDRFAWFYQNTTAVVTVSQQSDAPSNNQFLNSLRVAVTTADATIASNEQYIVYHIIEGHNVRDLIGTTFTLSFWARSSKTGIHCISFQNSVADRSYVIEYTVSAANTWEFKTVTVSGGLITAGTWDWTNGRGLQMNWCLGAGTVSQTTAGAWQPGNYYATANQVNCLDTIGNIFAITGVQLEAGAVATPFEQRPYGMELALCQRYYEIGLFNWTAYQVAGNGFGAQRGYAVQKRTTPTVTTSGVTSLNLTLGSPSLNVASNDSFTNNSTATATGAAAYAGTFQATAEL